MHQAHTDSGDLPGQGKALHLPSGNGTVECLVEGHPGARDAGRTCAAICLDDIAVTGNRELAKALQVHDGTQAPAHQALNLHGTTLAALVLALAARVGGSGQHGILGRDPAGMGALAPAGHALLHRGRADDARIAKLGQARAIGVLHHVGGELYGSHLIVGASIGTLGRQLLTVQSNWHMNLHSFKRRLFLENGGQEASPYVHSCACLSVYPPAPQ